MTPENVVHNTNVHHAKAAVPQFMTRSKFGLGRVANSHKTQADNLFVYRQEKSLQLAVYEEFMF
jgi:hypothetical protein